MTTIVWDGRTLAADRRCTDPNGVCSVKKLYVIPGGACASSGTTKYATRFADWARRGFTAPVPKIPSSQLDSIVVVDGEASTWEGTLRIDLAGPCAIGSGGMVARLAMKRGADAVTAVSWAAEVDPGTGDGVDSWSVP